MNTFKHFEYIVRVPYNKDQYDKEWTKPRKWLHENIGKCPIINIVSEDEATWKAKIEQETRDFVVTYSFKHKKDATFFALKWK